MAFSSRVPVFAALQAADYGAELPVAGGLIVLEGTRLARQRCDAAREPRATSRGEYPPGQDAVRSFESQRPIVAFEKILERRVQCLRFGEGEADLGRGVPALANEPSPGRSGPQ